MRLKFWFGNNIIRRIQIIIQGKEEFERRLKWEKEFNKEMDEFIFLLSDDEKMKKELLKIRNGYIWTFKNYLKGHWSFC